MKENTISRNQLILSALSKRLTSHHNSFQGDILEKDIMGLRKTISEVNDESTDEMMKWMTFAEQFPVDSDACLKALNELNGYLASKSVLVGEGLTPSEADIVVFSTVVSSVKSLQDSVKESFPHLMRWTDYIQNKEDFGKTFAPVLVQKDIFDPPASKPVEKIGVDSAAKKNAKDANNAEKASAPKSVEMGKVQGDAKAKTEKNSPEKVAAGKAATEKKLPEKVVEDISVSLLKIQVGLIRKAYKHPSADSLLVEEIDTGDAKVRQVVSGLAKFCSPDELTNRLVVLITNVKPGKLRDVMSEGLVLCASNEDHTAVEPLIAPEGAKIGEIVTFSGHDGEPEVVLNPKKKQLDKITPNLFTDDKGVATFKGVPFMTSAGPCSSSIPKASIK